MENEGFYCRGAAAEVQTYRSRPGEVPPRGDFGPVPFRRFSVARSCEQTLEAIRVTSCRFRPARIPHPSADRFASASISASPKIISHTPRTAASFAHALCSRERPVVGSLVVAFVHEAITVTSRD